MPPFPSEILKCLSSENNRKTVSGELPEDLLNFDLYVMIHSFAGIDILVMGKEKDMGTNTVV